MSADTTTPSPAAHPHQRVIKIRRDYNSWVARETMEDYALRFTPRSFRRWSSWRVANTAFGAASFLVLEAVGATMLVQAGFINALFAIIATGLIIFAAGLPISLYAARYGLDMDLLTRGAGFGYIGSTITSLIYASFTFIFFALEAAIMAYALEMAFAIPPAIGYVICAVVVIPLVIHGVTTISRLQTLTQPLWLAMLVLPFVYVLAADPGVLHGLAGYAGADGQGGAFSLAAFGGALSVGIALITQMGEQVDYLRFMPERHAGNRRRWLAAVVLGGPGWVVLGVAKMLGGALLAWLLLRNAVPPEKAIDPNQMYLVGFSYVFDAPGWALWATVVFVVVSQLKINVTNAYAGSLAWSNFFARLTHSHPGRVVWMVFNTAIALMLMELNVFQALGQVLGLYSNVAISWIMVVVADLVINKPLGLSPPGIEFKRSHLYDINPVGVGAMGLASALSVATWLGVFGAAVQPAAPFVALGSALVLTPLLAWLTGGRYYLARPAAPAGRGMVRCSVCEREYEADDTAHCPAYRGSICSLCCALDARCNDLCKPHARLAAQWNGVLRRVLPRVAVPYLETGLGHYLLLMAGIVPFLALLVGLLYTHEATALGAQHAALAPALQQGYVKTFAALLLVSGVVAWWLVLTHKSRQVAQEESNRQTALLVQEIDSHRRTDEQLQRARAAAEQANQAKSRYVTAISHELRTPLNSILGYAQILDGDPTIPPHRQQAIRVIRKSGDHLLSLIEGTLDLARIESGKLTLDLRPLDFPAFMQQLVGMFEQQAQAKGLGFRFEVQGELPAVVRADEKRLRQVLINLLGNAVKFTASGEVSLRLRHQRELAHLEIADTGPGIPPDEQARIFEPFARGGASLAGPGSGLGLTIARMLVALMGGELTLDSAPGRGSVFRVRLFLPLVHDARLRTRPAGRRVGYLGARRRILVVDNQREDRELLVALLAPLGFELAQAASGHECLGLVPAFRPELILMDLAMPGIDGWETIRRLRDTPAAGTPVAIVSANAFDRALLNMPGESGPAPGVVGAEDFFTKPLRVDELIDWIGRRLALEWVTTAAEDSAPAEPASAPDDPLLLRQLAEAVDLGYPRGIQRTLDELAQRHPGHGAFVQHLRDCASGFRFDAMREVLQAAREAVRP